MTIGLLDLAQYFAKNGRQRLLLKADRRGQSPERVAVSRTLVPRAVVFLIPLVIIRTLTTTQRAARLRRFRVPGENPYRLSITCISSCYNRVLIERRLSHRRSLQVRPHGTAGPSSSRLLPDKCAQR